MIWILEFALAAGLAGLVIPPAAWVATVLIPITLLLLPPALGARRACRGLNHPPFGMKISVMTERLFFSGPVRVRDGS